MPELRDSSTTASHLRTDSEDAFTSVYAVLRALARSQLRNEPRSPSLQATALVHEIYLKLADSASERRITGVELCAVASHVIREILVDHARTRGRLKRGGGWRRIPLSDAAEGLASEARSVDLLDLDAAMKDLESEDARAAKVVEMRFFGGMNNSEIAEALGISVRSVYSIFIDAQRQLRAKLLPHGRE